MGASVCLSTSFAPLISSSQEETGSRSDFPRLESRLVRHSTDKVGVSSCVVVCAAAVAGGLVAMILVFLLLRNSFFVPYQTGLRLLYRARLFCFDSHES